MTNSSVLLSIAKGHATGNDFLLVLDPDDANAPNQDLVQQLCDRRRGIGADGYIRAVKVGAGSANLSGADAPAAWFMDYRNADGSIAEMCGNGVRALVAFLESEGQIDLEPGTVTEVHTRAGIKLVTKATADTYSVLMGPWQLANPELAASHGGDVLVGAGGLEEPRPGLSVDMGNPHTVVALASSRELDDLDLSSAPSRDSETGDHTNVEFIVPLGEYPADGASGEVALVTHLRARVHERGVGETLSCGTGACAAAAAARYWAGGQGVSQWSVQMPGGVLQVSFLPDGEMLLTGPAVVVAKLQVDVNQLGK